MRLQCSINPRHVVDGNVGEPCTAEPGCRGTLQEAAAKKPILDNTEDFGPKKTAAPRSSRIRRLVIGGVTAIAITVVIVAIADRDKPGPVATAPAPAPATGTKAGPATTQTPGTKPASAPAAQAIKLTCTYDAQAAVECVGAGASKMKFTFTWLPVDQQSADTSKPPLGLIAIEFEGKKYASPPVSVVYGQPGALGEVMFAAK